METEYASLTNAAALLIMHVESTKSTLEGKIAGLHEVYEQQRPSNLVASMGKDTQPERSRSPNALFMRAKNIASLSKPTSVRSTSSRRSTTTHCERTTYMNDPSRVQSPSFSIQNQQLSFTGTLCIFPFSVFRECGGLTLQT